MAYSDFTREQLIGLGVTLDRERGRFAVPPVVPSPAFLAYLADAETVLQSTSTEKARSEWLIAPTLTELWRRAERRFTIFSGESLDVDPARGLVGRCDFILTGEAAAPIITHPIVVVVEAKRDDFDGGLNQCGAALVASQIRNGDHQPVLGIVTNGLLWQIIHMQHQTLAIDDRLYPLLDEPGLVLAVLEHQLPR